MAGDAVLAVAPGAPNGGLFPAAGQDDEHAHQRAGLWHRVSDSAAPSGRIDPPGGKRISGGPHRHPFEPELSEDVRADYAESLLSSATGRQIIPCFRRGEPSEAGSRTRCIGETSLAVGDAGRNGSLRRGDHRLCHEL